MKENLAGVSMQLSQKTDEVWKFSENLKEAKEALDKLKADYESLREGAADYLKLLAAHKRKEMELETTKKEIERLKEENVKLRSFQAYKWLGVGAFVLLMGLGIGSVVGRQGKKRRSSIYP